MLLLFSALCLDASYLCASLVSAPRLTTGLSGACLLPMHLFMDSGRALTLADSLHPGLMMAYLQIYIYIRT